MKRIIVSICLTVLCFCAKAQKPVITFETETYDFGEIKEELGVVTCNFNYTNEGKSPLVLHSVQPSCGCTTPEWTRTPIQAGEKGVIKISFNPANRPGAFNKTITVQTNAETAVKTLRITGKVIPKPKTIEDEYPMVMGDLRLSDVHLAFTKLAPDETKITEINIINTSDHDVKPEFINVPNHIKIASIPETLKPNEKGVIQANYNTALKNDWGFVTDNIYVIFDGKRTYTNRLTVSATISEDFSKLTEKELAKAPKAEFNEMSHDFGTIPPTDKVSFDFVITNKGKENLIIRKVKASCGCTAATPEKNILAKGESTKINVTFDPHNKSGRQNKTITVITNDPKQSTVTLRIMGLITTMDSSDFK
ncbi:MAG: DUF1573 domain-containing protein [Bacteroidales bacterium]|nr:DUF1573 domain-containing protein [Bacteroidales bacterium]